jgi:hypothetical protein
MSLPPFIDSVHAAELLGTTPEVILDYIASGKLRRFGGKPSNPFLRSADVQVLRDELGVGEETAAPRRVKGATARVQTRLTADARWSEISEADIREWAERADPARRQAARTAATLALERLQTLLRELDTTEGL